MVDSVFPATLVSDAPAGASLLRFTGSDVTDVELVRMAARENCRAVVFFDRKSLSQPGVREVAQEVGVGLVAVQAGDPVEAKERLLANFEHLRKALSESSVVIVLAVEARPVGDG
jgi:hypothetical protein